MALDSKGDHLKQLLKNAQSDIAQSEKTMSDYAIPCPTMSDQVIPAMYWHTSILKFIKTLIQYDDVGRGSLNFAQYSFIVVGVLF